MGLRAVLVAAIAVLATSCGGGGDQRADALQRVLDSDRRTFALPAVQAAVVAPGEAVWTGASGNANVEAGRAVSDDTFFAIGSITKTFVAALALKLVEDGVLRLDEPISRWLPEYPRSSRITLRQLLHHSSGVAEHVENPAFSEAILLAPMKRWRPGDALRFAGEPDFAPGASFQYSNTGYILVGLIIEKATHATVAVELRRRVLRPLGLESEVVLQGQQRLPEDHALGYGDFDQDSEPDSTPAAADLIPTPAAATAAWTAGGIAATAEGVARFGHALFGGKLLKPELLREMLDFGRVDYGLGVGRFRVLGQPAWGHGGGIYGFRSALWYLPRKRVTIVAQCNDERCGPIVAQDLLQAVLDPSSER